ncbi:hypothetical protein [Actinomyces marmotae]|nr:hypothetical protein [Actinomyces marmotae]
MPSHQLGTAAQPPRRPGITAPALLFQGTTRRALGDTQTGLRGHPAGALN